MARMCTALDDLDGEAWQRMQQDGLEFSSAGDLRAALEELRFDDADDRAGALRENC